MSYDITTTPRHKHSYSKITQVNNKPFESMSIISGALRNESRKKKCGKNPKDLPGHLINKNVD